MLDTVSDTQNPSASKGREKRRARERGKKGGKGKKGGSDGKQKKLES
jgi:hypothetical protein